MSTRPHNMQALSLRQTSGLNALAQFLVRVRQTRRRHKVQFEQKNEAVVTQSFACRRAAWRLTGKPSCRHGVLFTSMPDENCKCMSTVRCAADFATAKFMPALNHDLKIITAVRFDFDSYIRLGSLQSTARQLGW